MNDSSAPLRSSTCRWSCRSRSSSAPQSSATTGEATSSSTTSGSGCGGGSAASRPSLIKAWTLAEAFGSRCVDAVLPAFGDRFDLAFTEIREGADVVGRMDDDLLALERRVEVRDDPDPPGIADAEGLGRRAILGRRRRDNASSSGVASSGGGSQAPGRPARPGANTTRRPVSGSSQSPSGGGVLRLASRNGLKPMGNGRMIVEDRSS